MNESFDKYLNFIGKVIDDEDITSQKEDVDSKIHSINNEYTKNETQKRIHRTKILKTVIVLIYIQLIFFNIIVLIMLSSVIFNFSFFRVIDAKMTELILDFLKYYVSATVVELLGMFLLIIKNVFDSSLKDFWNNIKH